MSNTALNISSRIRQLLVNDLPGQHYQNKMSPVVENELYRIVPKDHKVACVMTLIHQKPNKEWFVTYIRRASSHPDDKHAGQIGFPGGKFESEDQSLLDCALREVEEELGIAPTNIEVLGELTSLYVYASNFLVYPYVGLLNSPPTYIPQESEVAGVLEIAVSDLLSDGYKIQKGITFASGHRQEVPGYDLGTDFLWGATAMITSEFEHILRQL